MAKKRKHIESTSQLALGGNVVIQVKEGKRTLKTLNIHNLATINLFIGIAEALSNIKGNIEQNLPRYLGAGTGVLEQGQDEVLLTGLITPIQMVMSLVERINSPRIIDKKGVVTFQSVLPYSSIGSTTIIKELGLYGNSNINSNTMVARVQIPGEGIQLSKGQSLYVQ